MTIRVTIWNEFRHEKQSAKAKGIYPEGMHMPIASYLQGQGMTVRVATLDEPEQGLSTAVLD